MHAASSNPYISNTKALDNFTKGRDLVFSSAFWRLLSVILLVGLIQAPANLVNALQDPQNPVPAISLAVSIYGFVLSTPIAVAGSWIFLKAVRQNQYSIFDLFTIFQRNYDQLLLANFLVGIVLLIGTLLLIIPGIIIGVRLSFVSYLVVDHRMTAIDAITASWNMTRGHFWTIFLMGLIAFVMILLGVLVFFVGVFISVLWISAAYAVLYQSIAVKHGIPGVPAEAIGAPAP